MNKLGFLIAFGVICFIHTGMLLASNGFAEGTPVKEVATNPYTQFIAYISSTGFLAWYAWYVTTKVLPKQHKEAADERNRIETLHNEQLHQLKEDTERRWQELRQDLIQFMNKLVTVIVSDDSKKGN